MTQRDYILRLAEEIGRALAQVLYHKQIKDYAGALNFIDEQYRQTLGMGAGFIHSVPEETLLAMLTSLGTLNTEKCWLLATLLKAEGEIYEEQNNQDESYYCYLKSLNLFLEVLLLDGNISDVDYVPELEGLLYKLHDYELPVKTSLKLLQYYENTGKFAKAEDILFDMLNSSMPDKAILQRGIAFYTRLRKKSDATLSAGNLSRVEVEEGLAKLKEMGLHPSG
ncbi:MAG TPA: DUF6483 family protein [Ktedonobacteraceae bacterium]|nr:DUF6483 family protein [Ktedonobacteraceae bacterium]